MNNIYYALINKTLVAYSPSGLSALLFDQNSKTEAVNELIKMFPGYSVIHSDDYTYAKEVIRQLDDHLFCTLSFDIKCGTEFQREVWNQLMKIPAGKTVTYTELAWMSNNPSAVRAVATACKLNPIPVFIPCHRVVPMSGGIGKYRWGAMMKAQLLVKEKGKNI